MGVNQTENYTAKREYHSAKMQRTSAGKPWLASFLPFVPLLIAVVLGIATTAGAITAFNQTRSTVYGYQAPGQMEYLGAPSLREVLW